MNFLFFRRIVHRLRLRRRCASAVRTEQGEQVAFENEAEDQQDDEAANADVHSAKYRRPHRPARLPDLSYVHCLTIA